MMKKERIVSFSLSLARPLFLSGHCVVYHSLELIYIVGFTHVHKHAHTRAFKCIVNKRRISLSPVC